jgi:lipopolysaccharide/colanic/teichoic acid biosynthesis glycosyltransferase
VHYRIYETLNPFMEFTFLPRQTFKNRTFAHYSIKSYYPAKESVTYGNSGFYYVGKNSANIQKLVKAFKRGYASEVLENAKFELMRSMKQENNTIPEVIFCEASFDINAIKSFRNFLNNDRVLSAIPFVLDASGLSEKELHQYRRNKLPDEIVSLNDFSEKDILAKSQFLKKVKSKANEFKANSGVETSSPIQNILKRTFDILVSLVVLTLLSPLFLLIALAIKAESGGPIFYVAKRAGKGYRIFDFFKFRTMFVGADEKIAEFAHLNVYNAGSGASGPMFIKINNDPRITKVGAFLRNSSLDELPQFVNVLLGDMSLVGNRPLPLYEAAALTTDEWAKRFMAPAGITGLWQIKKRGKEEMSAEERISLDIDYADNCNFVYDLWIMAQTPSALIQKTNA